MHEGLCNFRFKTLTIQYSLGETATICNHLESEELLTLLKYNSKYYKKNENNNYNFQITLRL